MASDNLSEKLFAQNKKAKETSMVINSSELLKAEQGAQEKYSPWYRILKRPDWIWQGLDAIEIEETLARIAVSENARTNASLLDTVVGYQGGNWSYEWSQAAMRHQLSALGAEDKSSERVQRELLKACRGFSVAAYPYLKGDPLAVQAETLTNKAFELQVKHAPFKVKTVTAKVDGRNFEGYLYLPHTDHPLPTVLVSAGVDCLQTDLWRLFETYFAPANIAMLTIDMQGIGKSRHWKLTQDTSYLHQAMLEEMRHLPWVDHFRVGVLGFRMGGNAAVRLAFVAPKKFKSCVSVGAGLHDVFYNIAALDYVPPMYADTLVSRMGKPAISTMLLMQLQSFSLKTQGLLGRRKTAVPILSLRLDGDKISSKSDNELAAASSQHGVAKELRSYHEIMTETMQWFTKTL